MKKWQIAIASIMALLLVMAAPLASLAADESSAAPARPALQGSLAIVAPRVVKPAEEMSLSVFLRQDQSPAEGAQVWAVDQDNVTRVKQMVKEIAKKGLDEAVLSEYQSRLEARAELIGTTDASGKVMTQFSETGKYLLLAIKPGYAPAMAGLLVRIVLVIDAPENTTAGDNVILTVTDKETGSGVEGVKVWAAGKMDKRSFTAAVKKAVLAARGKPADVNWQRLFKDRAKLLGVTDEAGQLTCTFDKEGKYLLVTVLNGEISGFGRIVIEAP